MKRLSWFKYLRSDVTNRVLHLVLEAAHLNLHAKL